jgi:DNA helicase IV
MTQRSFQAARRIRRPSITLTGQIVRSNGEKTIADYLTRRNTPYCYEVQATTNDWFVFKSNISKPDFFLPQYNLFVEYWGLVDAPTSGTKYDYIRTMRWKMAKYRGNSIRFISLYPSNLHELDYHSRRKFREVMGFDL